MYHDGKGEIDLLLRRLDAQTVIITSHPPTSSLPLNSQSFSTQNTPLQKPQSVILWAQNPASLVPSLRTHSLWPHRTRVLVIASQHNADVRAWVEQLWWWTRAVDVVVLTISGFSPQFYTWFPYQPLECSNVTTIVRLSTSALFPPKVQIGTPLNDCPLVAVTSPFPPLIVIDDFRGIEPRLFHDLAHAVGMKPAYARLPYQTFVWTTLNGKGEPANGLKLIWENKVDLMFSTLVLSATLADFTDFLTSHTPDKLVWYVPGPRPANRALAIFRAFSSTTWVLVVTVGACIVLTTVAIAHLEGHSRPALLRSVAINLYLPIHLSNSRIFGAFAMAAYIYSLHMTTAYQSSLIIFLSDVPRQKPIRQLSELVESNLKVQFHESHRPFLNIYSTSPLIAALNTPKRAIYSNLLNLALVADGENAALGPNLAFFSRIREEEFYDEYGYPKVISLEQGVRDSRLCFYISKGHPLQPLLDWYTLLLIEAGLPNHYAEELTKKPRSLVRRVAPFGLQNVAGAFVLFLAMMVACCLVWLTEIVGGTTCCSNIYTNIHRRVRKKPDSRVKLKSTTNILLRPRNRRKNHPRIPGTQNRTS